MKKLSLIITLIHMVCFASIMAQAGSLDPAFGGGDGLVATSFYQGQRTQGYGIAVHTNGRIMVSGYTRATDDYEYATLSCYLPDGSPDNSFNGSGKLVVPTAGTYSFSRTLAIQPDGKVVLVVIHYNSEETWLGLYRYLPDGSPDNSFDEDGIVITSFGANYLSASAIALQPDGKILIGGYVGQANESFDRFYVARYMPNGSLDNSFDGDGIAITSVGEAYTNVASLLIQANGKIIAAGYASFDTYDGFAAVRYNSNGTPDHSFGNNGIARATFGDGDDRCTGAVLQPDGKIVMGGYAHDMVTDKPAFAAARFNTDGTLDMSFHGDGMTVITVSSHADGARSILLQPDGKIVLAGYAHSDITGGADMAMVRLNTNGIPDFTFDGDGVAIYADDLETSSELQKIALQPDGKIVGTGFVRKEGLNAMRVARFITGLTVGVSDQFMPDIEMNVYPNPIVDDIVVSYKLDRKETISIGLYDVHGRHVLPLLPPVERLPGRYEERLSVKTKLAPGVYFVCFQSIDGMQSFKVVIE